MSVVVTAAGVILLEGACPIEDAEALLRRLGEDSRAVVDWSGCEQAHAAVIQVLLAARPNLLGIPTSAFLRDHVGPLIVGH